MTTVACRHLDVERADGSTYPLAYWEVDAGTEGPCVLVTAALHGSEVQGAEVLRRFVPEAEENLRRGRALLVPVANPLAVRARQPHIDFELGKSYGRDQVNNVNCTWPGKADGSNAQRLSHALYQALVSEATHLLDVHCWTEHWATTALARSGNEVSLRLAESVGVRFGRHGDWKPEVRQRPVFPCTLSSVFHDTGRAALAMELSGQYGFWAREVERGLRAVRNYFRFFELLPGEPDAGDEPFLWINDAEEVEVTAPHAGLFVGAGLRPSDAVEEGALLGHVLDLESLRTGEVRAPADGFLYQMGFGHEGTDENHTAWRHPYVDAGEVVAKVYRRKEKGA